jgi:hypothetical protein
MGERRCRPLASGVGQPRSTLTLLITSVTTPHSGRLSPQAVAIVDAMPDHEAGTHRRRDAVGAGHHPLGLAVEADHHDDDEIARRRDDIGDVAYWQRSARLHRNEWPSRRRRVTSA